MTGGREGEQGGELGGLDLLKTINPTECKRSLVYSGRELLRVRTPRTYKVPVPDEVAAEDVRRARGAVALDGVPDEDDEAVPLADAPEPAVVVPRLGVSLDGLGASNEPRVPQKA